MKQTICIKELALYVNIGVKEEERKRTQPILCDIEIEINAASAIETDNIEQTLDYSLLNKMLLKFVEDKEWQLLEKCHNNIVEYIIKNFDACQKVTCTTWKPLAIKNARNVGVRSVRSRE